MQKTTEKKVITVDSGISGSNMPNPKFDVNRFNGAIVNQGYNVLHEKAMKCPCVEKTTGSPLPDCTNCAGIGWFYIEKKTTKMLMQNLNNNKKFENWSEENMGTTTITSLFDDDITYMDKITNTDLLANFSQILTPRQYNNAVFAFTIYEPIEIFSIYKFVDSKNALELLRPNIDYTFQKNRIVFNITYSENLSFSIRYKHHPVYAIIDITREVFKAQQADCLVECDENTALGLRGMPMRSIGRKFHYLPDAQKFTGVWIQDNTDYTKFP